VRGLLADVATRHAIVELKVAVEFSGNLEMVDRESRYFTAGTAAKAGALLWFRGGDSADAFVLFTVREA
jgi:hypothetical protein